MGKKRKKACEKEREVAIENLILGKQIVFQHPLFSMLYIYTNKLTKKEMGRKIPWLVRSDGNIYLNKDFLLTPKEWAVGIVHCHLHLVFGHFDAEKMPGYETILADGCKEKHVSCDPRLWNIACDLYVEQFLADIKFGKMDSVLWQDEHLHPNMNERELYNALCENEYINTTLFSMDMEGLESPITYEKNESNHYAVDFARALSHAVSWTIDRAANHEGSISGHIEKASQWFLNHYPLLGGIASAFRIVEDYKICQEKEIQIAAVDVRLGEIYINPAAYLSVEELKFIFAHEYLHAGLQHYERCQGRDHYLWNVACDYVINGWLVEMKIGEIPRQGILYDEKLKGWSAEAVYDLLISDIRKYGKEDTFRGYGKGDFFGDGKWNKTGDGMSLDEFCRNALSQGLEYHQEKNRGVLPAGLIEEIRALAMPPIPWEVELARWFDIHFPPLEKTRSYTRPSRRQGTTPDIPRPRYMLDNHLAEGRTFGVVLDTSGSMSTQMIGKALGSIASYAAAKEVPYVRVVFCDASAYDAGYMTPEDIAGRVQVKGRGGTILQPGIDLLEDAKDFPKNGPILIITDGEIEDRIKIHRDHAFLIPRGKRLPFKVRGNIFYFE